VFVKQFLIGVGCLLVATAAHAQPQDHLAGHGPRHYDGAPLTMAQAIDEAVARNPTLSAARLEYEATRQKRRQEGFLDPPSFEAEIWQWPLTTVNPLDTNMYMFTMQQALPGRGKRDARAAVVDTDVDRASNAIVQQARNVVADVKLAYAYLFVSRQAVAVHDASVDLLRQTADLATARYGTGNGGQREVLKTVAEIARLHSDLVMLEGQAQLAAAKLNALLNRPQATPIGELSDPADAPPLPPVESLQRMALAQHPDLKHADIDISHAEASVVVADRDYKPDFMVGGGYQLMPRTAGAWTGSVGVTWPSAPWSRGRLDAAKAQAIADVATAKARRAVAVNTITAAVQTAYIRATSAGDRASILKTSVLPQTEQMFDAARVAYQSDRGDAIALLDDQRMLLDVQLDYLRAISEQQQARADLERAVGVDLESVR
jgi:outer membrane protein TolC